MPDEQLTFGFADQPPTADTLGASGLSRAQRISQRTHELALRGVYIGTSSWKYPGWLGQVYDPARYAVRGRVSERKFRDECLAEYATVFRTVCGDFAFYQFPTDEMWQGIFERLPTGYKFALKVPEDVTMERFPKQPRYGDRAGRSNPDFMNAALVKSMLLDKLEPYRDKLGPVIFEFTAIHGSELVKPANFAEALDRMLSRLPCDRFEISVEVRNPHFLAGSDGEQEERKNDAGTRGRGDAVKEEGARGRAGEGERKNDAGDSSSPYLEVLRKHNVAHVLNSWTRMPPVHEQMRIPGIFTACHVVSRWLLRPGRTYAEAVEAFTPYETTKDPYPEGRQALRDLIDRFVPDERIFYAYVNNRFEGSAIETIENVLGEL